MTAASFPARCILSAWKQKRVLEMGVCAQLVLAVPWCVVCSQSLRTKNQAGRRVKLHLSNTASEPEHFSLVNLVKLYFKLVLFCLGGTLQRVLHGKGFLSICFKPTKRF